jgi:hypothetical protein
MKKLVEKNNLHERISHSSIKNHTIYTQPNSPMIEEHQLFACGGRISGASGGSVIIGEEEAGGHAAGLIYGRVLNFSRVELDEL